MNLSTGALRRRKLSSATEIVPGLALGELTVILGLAILVLAAHMTVRMHWHLPGYRGVLDLTFLILARQALRHPWAATLTTAAAAGFALLPVMGGPGLIFLMSGLVVDLGYRAVPRWRSQIFFLLALAAMANGVKPLSRWVIAAVGDVHFGSLVNGIAYPLVSHLGFGLLGGLLAVGGWRVFKSRSRTRR